MGVLGKPFSDTINHYLAGGDEEGASKYIRQQLTDKRIDDAVTAAYKYLKYPASMGSGKPDPKAAAAAAAKKAGAGGAAQPNPNPTFKLINYNPDASTIDIQATTAAAKKEGATYQKFIMSRRAVLRGGARVQWKPDAESRR